MIMFGARGNTMKEMKKGLGYGETCSQKTIKSMLRDFMSKMEESKVLQIANSAYLKEGYILRGDFKSMAEKVFDAELINVDFSKKRKVAQEINAWTEKKTNGKIQDIIDEDEIDAEETIAVMLNAVYFKADWLRKFKCYETHDGTFHYNDNESGTVKLMQQCELFRYGVIKELNSSVVELPYEDCDMSMLIILPNSCTGLSKLEKDITKFDIFEIEKNLKELYVIVTLPKFKIEFKADLMTKNLQDVRYKNPKISMFKFLFSYRWE